MPGPNVIDWHGEVTHVLEDASGARAHVVPAVGANCIAFSVPMKRGRAHLLSTPASAEVLRGRPTFWGFPILAPYPGRHVTPFRWEGSDLHVQTVERPGVILHGFAARVPWRVVGSGPDFVTCVLDSETLPDRAAAWPFAFRLTTTHRVAGGRLTLTLAVENREPRHVPHLLGLHPYFPVRMTPTHDQLEDDALPTAAELVGADADTARETCTAWARGDDWWEMSAGLGTGVIESLDGASGAPYDIRAGRSIADLERSLAWGGTPGTIPAGTAPRLPVLLYGDRAALAGARAGHDPWAPGGLVTGIDDHASRVRATLETSAGFGSNALFCPPGFPFVSLEPRSAVSNALGLATTHPHRENGIFRLGSGETWRAWASLSGSAI
jgi:hypothetical protein